MKKFLLWLSMISAFTATLQPIMAMEDESENTTKEMWEMSYRELENYYNESDTYKDDESRAFDDLSEYLYVDDETNEIKVNPATTDIENFSGYDLEDKSSMLKSYADALYEFELDIPDEETLAKLDDMQLFLSEIYAKIELGDIVYDGTGYYAAELYEDYTVQAARNDVGFRGFHKNVPIYAIKFKKFKPVVYIKTYISVFVPTGYRMELKSNVGIALGATSLALKEGSLLLLGQNKYYRWLETGVTQLAITAQTLRSVEKYISRVGTASNAVAAINAGWNATDNNLSEEDFSYAQKLIKDGFDFTTATSPSGKISMIDNILPIQADISYLLDMMALSMSVNAAVNAVNLLAGPAGYLIAKAAFAIATTAFYKLIGEEVLRTSISCELSSKVGNNSNFRVIAKNSVPELFGADKAPSGCTGTYYTASLTLTGIKSHYIV